VSLLKRLGFWVAYVVPLSIAAGLVFGGVSCWLPLLVVFVLIPVADRLIGENFENPATDAAVSALQKSNYFRAITILYPFVQTLLLALALVNLAGGEWTWFERLGIFLSLPLLTGGIGITVAHELGHRNSRLERGLAKALLSQVLYTHFIVEHNLGHHLEVATPEDPSSARYGESFYRFWPRTVSGTWRSAVRLERERLKKLQARVRGPRNQIFQSVAFPLAWVLFFLVIAKAWTGDFEFLVIPYFLAQAVLAFTLLELVNYIEHYGLARKKDASTGRYERVAPEHSWNSSYFLSNLLLFQLQRHSDHHVYPARRYPALRHHERAPQLPAGYPTMVLAALAPPVWRRLVHPRLAAFRDGA